MLILHYTGMASAAAALDRLCDPDAKVSAHYLVHEDGATLRTLSLAGGGTIVERLERVDDTERSYTYSILSGPLPVADYVATLRVRANEGGLGCTIEWSSEFTPTGAPESDAVAAIRGVYEAGFENLKRMFGG